MDDPSQFRVPFSPREPFEEIRTGAGLRLGQARALVKTTFVTVLESPAVLASGKFVPDFYAIRRGDGVNVVPFVPDARAFVMIRKIRTASGIAYYGFPGGMLQGGNLMAHALAELKEETGLEARDPIPLGHVHRGPESSPDRDYFYFATVHSVDGMRGDGEEGISVGTVGLADALELAMSQYFDPYHAAAFWRALPHVATIVGIDALREDFERALIKTLGALGL